MELGGKASNLNTLVKAGFNVPALITVAPYFTIKAEFYSELNSAIKEDGLYAVRSSSAKEDTDNSAMAGQFYSELAVPFENLFEAYIKVVESFKGSDGAVIIQEFIPSQKAGVLFTNAGQNTIVINANFGLCKTVVDGLPCDEYIIKNNEKIQPTIAKNKQVQLFKNGAIVDEFVENEQVLEQTEIEQIVAEGKKIEKLFGKPQDIEFCLYKNELVILQSRPITRKLFYDDEKVHFDNANIAESYSGIVLPLTFTFAQEVYKTVYINLLQASGVSRKKIQHNISIFNNMLAGFYGRMYYNITNWYLMMSFVPGYERNKDNLETMISSNVQEKVLRTVRPSFWYKLTYPLLLIVKMILLGPSVKRFITKTTVKILEYRKLPFNKLTADECEKHYKILYNELLQKWHIPVENDFMLMTYFGALKKRMSESELQKYIHFENKSVTQIDALKKLAKVLFSYTEITTAIESYNGKMLSEALKKNIVAYSEYEKYFEVYGGRFGNELKLESPDIEEDPQKLCSLLLAYKDIPENGIIKQYRPKITGKLNSYLLKKFTHYASQREEMRLLRSNCFSIVRKICNRMGELYVHNGVLQNIDDVYYLHINELFGAPQNAHELVASRKLEYATFADKEPASFFTIHEQEQAPLKQELLHGTNKLEARPCTPGIVEGVIHVFQEYYIPDDMNYDIIVAKHTDPGWTTLLGLAKGLIIEHGGVLSHAAIVSRELGIPTVIGLENATQILKTGMRVRVYGSTGIIEIIE